MTTTPLANILAFTLDDDGDWVAMLECGHRQHVRHKPPLMARPWVTTAAGRAEKIGQALACRNCLMPRLPPAVQEYKRTAIFDAQSVPAGLLKAHTLKAETWAEIVVLTGRVTYVIEGMVDGVWVLGPNLRGTVAPTQPHHIEPTSDATFYVRFLRAVASPAPA
jgi:tellurite methyltransferase